MSMDLEQELKKVKIESHTPQLNPNRGSNNSVPFILGRARISYNGSFKVVSPVSKPRAIKRSIVQLITGSKSLTFKDLKKNAVKLFLESLVKKVNDSIKESVNSADPSVYQKKSEKLAIKKMDLAKKQRIELAHTTVLKAFTDFGDILTEETITRLWEQAIITSVLRS